MTDAPAEKPTLVDQPAPDAEDVRAALRDDRWDDEWTEEYRPVTAVGAAPTPALDQQPGAPVEVLDDASVRLAGGAADDQEDADPEVAGFAREASEVLALGADVAARETSRDPDDPEAVTEGVTAAAVNWEQRAAQVGAAAPRAARSPAALARVAQAAGSTASLAYRVRELHGDQEEAEIVDQGVDARQRTAMQRIEQIRGQATDLAYTIDPAPRPGPHLQH